MSYLIRITVQLASSECDHTECYYTVSEQRRHAEARLSRGAVESLDESGARASVCVACDVPLRDKCTITNDAGQLSADQLLSAPRLFEIPAESADLPAAATLLVHNLHS